MTYCVVSNLCVVVTKFLAPKTPEVLRIDQACTDVQTRCCGFVSEFDLATFEIREGRPNPLSENQTFRASVIFLNRDRTHNLGRPRSFS